METYVPKSEIRNEEWIKTDNSNEFTEKIEPNEQ